MQTPSSVSSPCAPSSTLYLHHSELLDASHTRCFFSTLCFAPETASLRCPVFSISELSTLYLFFTSFSQETFPDPPPSHPQLEIIISSFHYVYTYLFACCFLLYVVLYLLMFIPSPLSDKILKSRSASMPIQIFVGKMNEELL